MEIPFRRELGLAAYAEVFSVSRYLLEAANQNPTQVITIPGYEQTTTFITSAKLICELADCAGITTEQLQLANPEMPNLIPAYQRIIVPKKRAHQMKNRQIDYTYEALCQDIMQLRQTYPFFQVKPAFQSVLGKNVPELIIGNGPHKVHINASFHGNEWITASVLMQCVNEYLDALLADDEIDGKKAADFFHRTTLSIVPMVNPDGVDLVLGGSAFAEEYEELVLFLNSGSENFSSWKANILGVDLNKQYPAKWEYERDRKPKLPGPRDFPGINPLSEPESLGMYQLVNKQKPDIVVCFHTQGEEIYYSYEELEPAEAEKAAWEMSKRSGYQPIKNLDNYAGFKDWFISAFKKMGFTIEIGKGVNPLPIEQFPAIYQKSRSIFFYALML